MRTPRSRFTIVKEMQEFARMNNDRGELMEEAYIANFNISQIADLMGLGRATIKRELNKRGHVIQNNGRKGH